MYKTEELEERVKNNDTDWFYQIYNENYGNKSIEIVYDQHWGDGNDYFLAIKFIENNLVVQLEGYYSSWDSPGWDKVYFALEYEYKETRFKKGTLSEIRESKIKDVLDK